MVLKSFPTRLSSDGGFCHKDHNLWVIAITENNGGGLGQLFYGDTAISTDVHLRAHFQISRKAT